MKKVFFFDVDDTLLPTEADSQIPESTLTALKALRNQGHDVFIATGKSKKMLGDVLELLEVDNYISSNGQAITINGEIYKDNPINVEDIGRIQDIIDRDSADVILGVQGHTEYYVFPTDEKRYEDYVVGSFKDLSMEIPKINDNPDYDRPIYQLWLLGKVDDIDKDKYMEVFDLFRWNPQGYDLLPHNVSKATAIQELLNEYYSGEDVEVYAFGDGENDIEMLKLADHGVAMGNAKPEVKEIADYVTDTSANEGIHKFLKEKQLI